MLAVKYPSTIQNGKYITDPQRGRYESHRIGPPRFLVIAGPAAWGARPWGFFMSKRVAPAETDIDAYLVQFEELLLARNRVRHVKAQMQVTQDAYDRRMTILEGDLISAEKQFDQLSEQVGRLSERVAKIMCVPVRSAG